MPANFDVRITVFTGKMISSLIRDQGKSGRRILLDRLGPELRPVLEDLSQKTKEVILEAYQTPGFVPGDALRMAFLGGYGDSVQKRYRVQTAQTWPWAYVGLYPQTGADTLQSRNPAIYIPSIEGGMVPHGWTKSPKTSSGGWIMFARIGHWVEKKIGLSKGSRRHHDFTWLLYKKILAKGTRAKQLFQRVETTPEFARALTWRQNQILAAIMRAFEMGE